MTYSLAAQQNFKAFWRVLVTLFHLQQLGRRPARDNVLESAIVIFLFGYHQLPSIKDVDLFLDHTVAL